MQKVFTIKISKRLTEAKSKVKLFFAPGAADLKRVNPE